MEPQKLQLLQELEIEAMADMYNRLTAACHKKCIPPIYGDSDIAKGEAVCLDRCVAKFLDIHDRIGKRFGEISNQEQEAALGK